MTRCTNDTMAVLRPQKLVHAVADDDSDDDSLTDVSVFAPTSKSTEYQSISSGHDEFVPDKQLLQSLFAYANSFQLDGNVYSTEDFQSQLQPWNAVTEEPTHSSTGRKVFYPENERATRQQSCEDLSKTAKSTVTVQQKLISSIPTDFFTSKQQKDDYDDKHSDGSTAVTDGSKFEWELSSKKSCQSYITTDYTQQSSSTNFSQKSRSTPIIIREKSRAVFAQDNPDIPFLQVPTPIIIREILHKSSLPQQPITKHHLTPSITTFPVYDPPMVSGKRKMMYESTQHERHADGNLKKIIIEYDQINVTVDQHVKQRKEIKRVSPYRYLQQHGPTLYSKDVFQNLLHNIIS